MPFLAWQRPEGRLAVHWARGPGAFGDGRCLHAMPPVTAGSFGHGPSGASVIAPLTTRTRSNQALSRTPGRQGLRRPDRLYSQDRKSVV